MKSNNLKLAVSIFTLLINVSLFAQGPPGGGQGGRGGGNSQGQQRGGKPDASKILSLLDTNHDDLIDKEEASKDKRGKISEDFDEIDTNDDEFIDLEELKASLNASKPKVISAEKILKEVDDNGDGTLNKLEVAAKDNKQLTKNFNAIDTNQDNELDIDELKVFFEKDDAKDKKSKRKKRN